MPRLAQNRLTIEPTSDAKGSPNGFRLFGFFNGKKIRKANKDLSQLETLKASLEAAQVQQELAEQVRSMPRMTWLSVEQVRDAEAAFRARGDQPYSLLDYVGAAKPLMDGPAPKLAAEAMEGWLSMQKAKKFSDRTLVNNRSAIRSFLAETKVKFLGEINQNMIETYVLKPDLSIQAQVARGTPVKAWLNFCLGRKPAWLRSNPFTLDLGEMAEMGGRQKSEDGILTPPQCQALLDAAIKFQGGKMLPYVILSTWTFMRSAEVERCMGSDIKLGTANTVGVWGKKRGGKFRVVNIPANMVPLLQECFARGLIVNNEPIYFSRFQWNQVRHDAGLLVIDNKAERGPGGRKILESIWEENILRHTGESYLYQKTGDITHCTNQAGHSKEIAFKHYLRLPQAGDSEQFYAITGQLAPLPLEQTG